MSNEDGTGSCTAKRFCSGAEQRCCNGSPPRTHYNQVYASFRRLFCNSFSRSALYYNSFPIELVKVCRMSMLFDQFFKEPFDVKEPLYVTVPVRWTALHTMAYEEFG